MGASFAKSIYTESYWDLAAVTAIGAANVATMLAVSDDTIKTMYACWLAVRLGSNFWIGTTAGPTMFLNMERRQFGNIQSKLFPKYGLIASAASGICCAAYHLTGGDLLSSTTGRLLLATGGIHLFNSSVLFPISTKYMFESRVAEDKKDDAEFKRLRKRFGMFHGISVLINYAGLVMDCALFASMAGNAKSL